MTGAARTHVGPSRNGFRVRTDGGPRTGTAYLQLESETRALRGTEFTPEREARVLAATRRAGIPVPEVFGASSDHGAILMEFVPGSSDLEQEAERDRRAIGRDYMRALSDLHASTTQLVTELAEPLGLAADPEADPVAADIRTWRGIYEDRTDGSCPYVNAALALLDDARPGTENRAFVHGDAGAGNFLHREGELRALVDWEISHLGDAAEDLAWIRVRETLGGGLDSFEERLADYERAAGTSVPVGRIDRFEILALAKCCISFFIQESSPRWDASQFAVETAMYGWLYRHLLALRMLAHAGGADGPSDPGRHEDLDVGQRPEPDLSRWLGVIRTQLKDLGGADGSWDDLEERRAKALVRLIDHLRFREENPAPGMSGDAGAAGSPLERLARVSSWHVRSWKPLRRLAGAQGIPLHE